MLSFSAVLYRDRTFLFLLPLKFIALLESMAWCSSNLQTCQPFSLPGTFLFLSCVCLEPHPQAWWPPHGIFSASALSCRLHPCLSMNRPGYAFNLYPSSGILSSTLNTSLGFLVSVPVGLLVFFQFSVSSSHGFWFPTEIFSLIFYFLNMLITFFLCVWRLPLFEPLTCLFLLSVISLGL